MMTPGGQAFGAAAIAWAVRPPDPIEVILATTTHVGVLL